MQPIRDAINPKQIYTVAETATIFGVGYSTILRFLHQGNFANSWKDGSNHIKGDSILSFLKKGELAYNLKKKVNHARD